MRDTITIVALVAFIGYIAVTLDQKIESGLNNVLNNQSIRCQ